MGKYFQNDKLNLLFLVLFNLGLRLFRLDSPAKPFFDEGAFYLEAARSYLTSFTDPNFEHPPLGKIIIALGILIAGDNPWGWRIMPVLFGTLGVVVTYLLAKKMFKSTKVALWAGFFLTFDFMWFVFSRAALLEIFLATFSLLAIYFLWNYYRYEKTKDMVLFSIFLGLGLATKWSAALVLLGAVVLLALKPKANWVSLIWKVIIVGFISLLIYLASYVPYLLQNHSAQQFWERQVRMWQYHTREVQDDAAGSVRPYLWLLNPIQTLYQPDAAVRTHVIVLANPIFFWGSLVAAIFYLRKLFKKWDEESGFLLIIILSQFLPWFLVGRYLFFYYFLPAMPLLAIILGKLLTDLESAEVRWGRVILRLRNLFVTGNALGFVLFYPILTALPVTGWYLHMLRVGN